MKCSLGISKFLEEISSLSHSVVFLYFQLHYFMANRRGKVEVMTDFLFFGSKITADGDCSHEIRRPLLLGRKAMTNPESVLKSRDITLPTKVWIVKAMVFPVVQL